MAAWKLSDINGHQIYVLYPEKKCECVFVEKKKGELFSQHNTLLFQTGLKHQVTTSFVCNTLSLLKTRKPY
jgi:hypothetical protein